MALQLWVDLIILVTLKLAVVRNYTSCGIKPAIRTKLVSAAVSTFVLLKMYPHINLASVPDLSI
jgi:hypothetical protein